MKTLVTSLIVLIVAPLVAMGQFKFRDLDSKSVELTENGSPVWEVSDESWVEVEPLIPVRQRSNE